MATRFEASWTLGEANIVKRALEGRKEDLAEMTSRAAPDDMQATRREVEEIGALLERDFR